MSDSIYEGAIRDKIARDSTDSKPLLKEFSSALFETLREGLLYDGHVRIHQFGSFKLKWSNERKGKHPRTGEPLIIPAQPRITFTAAKNLKDKVNREIAVQIEPIAEPIAEPLQATVAAPVSTLTPTTESVSPTFESDDVTTEAPKLATPQQTGTQHQTSRMTAIAATVLCAAVIAYFFATPSTQEPAQTANNSSNLEPRALPSSTSRSSLITINDAETTHSTTETAASSTTAIPVTETSHTETASVDNRPVPYFKQRQHRLINGDSLWRLSRKSYSNPFYWPHIYQANRSGIRNPNKLRMGRTITLPSLYGSPDALTAEDKRNIAEGYFQVYRYYKKTDRPFPYYALLGASKFDPAVIQDHIYEIDEQDWQSLQLASN